MGASIWSGNTTVSASNKYIEEFTATANQVLFTLTTFSYTLGPFAVQVFINGLLQSENDFTQTSSTEITLDNPSTAGDVVTVSAIII